MSIIRAVARSFGEAPDVDGSADPAAGLTVVFAGSLGPGQHSRARLQALERLGSRVVPVDLTPVGPSPARLPATWRALRRRLSWPVDEADVNGRLPAAVERANPDLVWLEKALAVRPATIEALRRLRPRVCIVAYQPDTLRSWGQRSIQLLGVARRCDAVITTNPQAQRDLQRLGCGRVIWAEKAFDPLLHRPLDLSSEERAQWGAPVGFAGFWEAPRARCLARLQEDGAPLKIWGQHWERRTRGKPLAAAVAGGARFGEDYARILNSFDIGLCFLRRKAGDRVTSRSIEIPACGTFMLAERTQEHRVLFREGIEAEFFEGYDELRHKVRYYLEHPDERRAVAEAGRRRCVESGYDQDSRMRALLRRILG